MAVIERSGTLSRRSFVRVSGAGACLGLVNALSADSASDVLDVLNRVAAALEAGNAALALEPFDKSMSDYGQLKDYFLGLTSQVSAHTDIDVLEQSDTATESKVSLRWILDLRDKVTNASVDRRIQEVHVRLSPPKSKPGTWRITYLEPVELFNPAVGP